MQIRPAIADDIESILAMQSRIHADHLAWDGARWTTAMPLDAAYLAWLTHLVTHPADGLALVATVDDEPANSATPNASRGRIAGYLIAEIEPESTKHWSPAAVYLHDLYVDQAHRRSGIAKQLMTQVLQWAGENHSTLQLRLVTAVRNEAARAFFERFGFRACVVEMIRA